ncbi:MAG: conjugal transfer protein TraH [Pseudomonadota bacterium]|nr:conjugal transfer protein TraH [Pseudomonadota bacterium]
MKTATLLLAACITAAIALCAPARADLGEDLEAFFGDMNYANVTQPGVYEGQSAGYFTGGGLYVRNPVREFDLVNVQMPRFRAGCGGIDMYLGGFSYIDSDMFVELLRSIGENATGLAFMLAMQVVSPQITESSAKLNSWAQEYLMNDINSCEAATSMLGGALEMAGATEQACILNRTQNLGEDYATAKVACRNNPNDDGAAADAPRLLFTRGNLAWRAMMKIPFFQSDLDLAEAVMNLTGTLIVEADTDSADPAPQFRRIPSLLVASGGSAENAALLTAMIEGGSADIYTCVDASASENACEQTSASPEAVTISSSQALQPKVESLLMGLVEKLRDDSGSPTDDELGLIRSTSLPVYKYLTVSTAYFPTNAESEAKQYSFLIAKDLLYVYLTDLLRAVEAGAARMQDNAGQSTVAGFLVDIREARRAISQAQGKVRDDFQFALDMTNRTRNYEHALVSRLSPTVVQAALYNPQR